MRKIILTLLTASSLFSMEFAPMGFRSIGMGGAGVANATGSMASYYNPALLANHNYSFETSLSAGIGLREINLINPIDKLANTYKLTETIDKITENAPISGKNSHDDYRADLKIQGAISEIYKLSQGNGFDISPTIAFGMQMGNYSLGVYSISEISSSAVIDRQHLYLIFEDEENGGYYYYDPKKDTYGATEVDSYENYSLKYALDNNLTYLSVKGMVVAEVPISYATSFEVKGAVINIGASLKYVQGITYKNMLALDTDSDKLEDSLKDNQKQSSDIGIDLGLLIKSDDIRIGMVGKYLNKPEFDFYDGSKYRIDPMLRGGFAFDLADWISFAMDVDFTQNETFIPDYKSQYVGGGVDIHTTAGYWLGFSLRVGAMRNMVQDEEGTILTAGVGLGLKWLQIDIAGEMATKTSIYDGNKVPRYGKVNVAIISRWGGGD